MPEGTREKWNMTPSDTPSAAASPIDARRTWRRRHKRWRHELLASRTSQLDTVADKKITFYYIGGF